jgi:hypothetical protein
MSFLKRVLNHDIALIFVILTSQYNIKTRYNTHNLGNNLRESIVGNVNGNNIVMIEEDYMTGSQVDNHQTRRQKRGTEIINEM